MLRFQVRNFVYLLITMIFSAGIYFVDSSGLLYKANLLEFPQHKPFDGTVYPIKRVPNWAALNASDWKKNFNDLGNGDFIDLPEYLPEKLKFPTDQLAWKNPEHDIIRNMKITFSVPYLGNYNLDGLENVGSHPAVDIKVPTNTPIYAMANGTVIKASRQGSGFGNHIVLRHDNFPGYEDKNKLNTIYSSYSHLGDLNVNVGDVVDKGKQIGISGSSGIATTPHLHFQIDTDQAPWHPFWLFSSQEASNAGLSFFEAVNSGLGREKAAETNINPLLYVKKYLNENASSIGTNVNAQSYVAQSDSSSETPALGVKANDAVEVASPATNSEDAVLTSTEAVSASSTTTAAVDSKQLTFDIRVSNTYSTGQATNFTVYMRTQDGMPYTDGFNGEIILTSEKGNFTVKNPILSAVQFDNDAKSTNSFSRLEVGSDRIKLQHDGDVYFSDTFEIVEGDANKIFNDVSKSHKNYKAIAYLSKKSVIEGYSDGTFRPYKPVNRVEALKFILEGINANLVTGKLPFNDTQTNEWYAGYLYTGYKKNIVNGDPDGKFRPADSVNRAEFLKILFSGMGVQVADKIEVSPYSGVSVDSWYAPYVAKAKELKILDDDLASFDASAVMSRGEVAEIMYRAIKGK